MWQTVTVQCHFINSLNRAQVTFSVYPVQEKTTIFEKWSCLTNFNYKENVKLKKNVHCLYYVLSFMFWTSRKKLLLARQGCDTGIVLSSITVNDFLFLMHPINRTYTKEIKLKNDLLAKLPPENLSWTERVKNAAALQYIYGHTAHFIPSLLFSPKKMQWRWFSDL